MREKNSLPFLVLQDSPRAVRKHFPANCLESLFVHPPRDPNSLSLSGARELALGTSSQVTPAWLGRSTFPEAPLQGTSAT